MAADFVNYYEILEIAQTADDAAIDEAIKTQIRTWAKRQSHPDQERRHQAEVRMKQITEAERILTDPARRQTYDQQLANYRPSTTPASMEGVSSDWLERAREFLARDDAASASYAARQATEQQGNNDEAWAIRAQSSFLMGRQQDAVFEFSEALRIRPDEPSYHFDLGSVYESDRQWQPALNSYEQAARIAPHVPMFRVAVASVYLQNDMAPKALPILEQAIKEDPNDESFQFYLAIALHDSALDGMTQLRNGNVIITTEQQAKNSVALAERGLKLKFNDSELRQSLTELRANGQGALATKLYNPFTTTFEFGFQAGCLVNVIAWVFIATFPIIFFESNAALGIVIAAGWYFAMYKWLFRPVWKINDKRSKDLQIRGRA